MYEYVNISPFFGIDLPVCRKNSTSLPAVPVPTCRKLRAPIIVSNCLDRRHRSSIFFTVYRNSAATLNVATAKLSFTVKPEVVITR